MWDPYGNAGANTGTPPPLSHPGPGEGEAQGTTRCMAEVRPRHHSQPKVPSRAATPTQNPGPQEHPACPMGLHPQGLAGRTWQEGCCRGHWRHAHPLKGFRGLRWPAAGGSGGLGDEAAAQAEAEGRDQQDADVGRHEAHRVGEVVQVQPGGRNGHGGGVRGGPLRSDHVTGPPGTRETLTW